MDRRGYNFSNLFGSLQYAVELSVFVVQSHFPIPDPFFSKANGLWRSDNFWLAPERGFRILEDGAWVDPHVNCFILQGHTLNCEEYELRVRQK